MQFAGRRSASNFCRMVQNLHACLVAQNRLRYHLNAHTVPGRQMLLVAQMVVPGAIGRLPCTARQAVSRKLHDLVQANCETPEKAP